MNIIIGYAEIGLQIYNIHSSYPKAFSRQAFAIVSKHSFAPTELSRNNLIQRR